MSLETGTRRALPDTSIRQREMDILATLGDLNAHGIKTHALMEDVDTSTGDLFAHEVEEATSEPSTLKPVIKHVAFERASIFLGRRKSRRIASRLLRRR